MTAAPGDKDGRQKGKDAQALSWAQTGPVLFLALIFFINFSSRIILAPFLPTIERDLGLSHGQAGFFFLLISAGYVGALMGSGFLSSWLTHRRAIVASSACVGIALLSISIMNSASAVRAGLLFLGLGAGLYLPSAIATITALVPPTHWGKAIAVHEMAPNLGFMAAPFLAELFLRWSSWRAALASLGLTAVTAGIAFARYGKGGEFRGEPLDSGSIGMLVRQSSFWIVVILFALGIGSTLGIFAMLPVYLVTERKMDQSCANTLIAVSRMAAPLMSFLAGWASDRLGPRRTMALSLLLTGIATLLLGPARGFWIVAFVFVQPALSVCFFPAGFSALSMISPVGSRNVAVSLTVPLGFLLGAGVTPTFIGMMGDAGSFALGFTLVGALIVSGGVLALCMKLSDKR